nr:MAG: capsid protein [clictilig virus 3]
MSRLCSADQVLTIMNRKQNNNKPVQSRNVVPARRARRRRGAPGRSTDIGVPSVGFAGGGTRVLSNMGDRSSPFGEFWFSTVGDPKGTIQSKPFDPGNTGMLVLDAVAKAYDNYIVRRIRLNIRGRGPTTSSASTFACVDFDPVKTATTRDQILQIQPSVSLAAYQAHSINLTGRSIMRRNMFVTNGSTAENATAFLVTYSSILPAQDTSVWEVWVQYDVEFLHPAPLNS